MTTETQKATARPMEMHKCQCGHPSCNQYTLTGQGSVGFDKEHAESIIKAVNAHDDLVKALRNAEETIDTWRKTGCAPSYHILIAVQDAARAALTKVDGKAIAQECEHLWELVPGSYGLIDRCTLCGEERA